MGIGLGVLFGSILKTIALNNRNDQITNSNWSSKDRSRIRNKKSLLQKNFFKDESIRSINNFQNKQAEIITLSTTWGKLLNKHQDLEASGFLFLLDDGRYAELNSKLPLPAASSIKVPLLLLTLEMIDKGELLWDEELQLTKEIIGGGAGWMAYQPIGKFFPVHEITTEMIRVSDNTATNLLIKRLGGKEIINERLKLLGFNETAINNLLPDLQGTNTTSARDLAKAIAIADAGLFLSQRSRDLFREVMSTSTTNSLLPGGLLRGLGVSSQEPDYHLLIKGYRVYNKTGDIGIAYVDTGLIQMPNMQRAVAGFIVKGPFNDPRSAELIREMAAASASFLKPKGSKNQ